MKTYKFRRKRTYIPYEKEYCNLIGKELTIEELNDFTYKLQFNYEEKIIVEKGVFCEDFIEKWYLFYQFNFLSLDYISQEEELMNHDFDINNISFDIIEYNPTDYHLTITFSFNPATEKIIITSVGVNS